MEIPAQLTFSVSDAARLLGMDRGSLHKMIKEGSIREDEWFTTSGRRPSVRIKRVCLERLAGVAPSITAARS